MLYYYCSGTTVVFHSAVVRRFTYHTTHSYRYTKTYCKKPSAFTLSSTVRVYRSLVTVTSDQSVS